MLKYKNKIVIPYLLPAFLLYAVFFIYPAIDALRISLTDWSGFVNKPNFIGLNNFIRISKDGNFGIAVSNSLIIMLLGGGIIFFFVLLFAFLLTNCMKEKSRKFFLNLFYFPNMISAAAIAVVWGFIFDGNFGIVNNFLVSIGLEKLAIPWLGARNSAMSVLLFIALWTYMGFYLILINAGISKIPDSFFEAARVEGANRLKIFFSITLPMIWDVVIIAFSLWFINSLKLFEMIWSLTRGGPANKTHVMGTYIYLNAFGFLETQTFQLGYATACAVVLLAMLMIIVLVFQKTASKDTYEY
jgi:raffinose/stachyose/melibiose transport system permease protein